MKLTFGTKSAGPFATITHTAAEHFRLAMLGVVQHVIEQYPTGGVEAALEAQPFLADYYEEVTALVGRKGSPASRWRRALVKWEAAAPGHLPLCALIDAGMTRRALELLLVTGLVEEDPRFGELFQRAQGRYPRPTLGLLIAWWRTGEHGADEAEAVRATLLELLHTRLLTVLNPNEPRPEWVLAVPHQLWDGLRGDVPAVHGLTYRSHDLLPASDAYIAPPGADAVCTALPALLEAEPDHIVVVRGAAHNGRKALLGCVARAAGCSLLIADDSVLDDEVRWNLFGILATLLHAYPVVDAQLAAGETRVLPPLPFARAPLGVVTGRHGAWSSGSGRPLLTIDLPLPNQDQRLRHWSVIMPGQKPATHHALAAGTRLTSGNIRRAAAAAAAFARLANRSDIELSDLQAACRTLHTGPLEMLATRLPAAGTLADLVVDNGTREELEALVVRCRQREQLAAAAATVAQANTGIRALFAGPSGSGKTLAARLLAASLGKDLYRVDLAATVNKYLGETEKNLDQAFAAAEECDVVLLLDEGDALMANRTAVGTSNDRYANLETNFLLQRVEAYDGILIVTSNAADRIDDSFARRLDVVVHFRSPDEWRRYDILRLHLNGDDRVDDTWLQEAAVRCALSGGQWRNVVSHARLLALSAAQPLDTSHLHAALVREYRKAGAQCPLRTAAPSIAARS
jgi:hypothetical protein